HSALLSFPTRRSSDLRHLLVPADNRVCLPCAGVRPLSGTSAGKQIPFRAQGGVMLDSRQRSIWIRFMAVVGLVAQAFAQGGATGDRKSTRLNSSHGSM